MMVRIRGTIQNSPTFQVSESWKFTQRRTSELASCWWWSLQKGGYFRIIPKSSSCHGWPFQYWNNHGDLGCSMRNQTRHVRHVCSSPSQWSSGCSKLSGAIGKSAGICRKSLLFIMQKPWFPVNFPSNQLNWVWEWKTASQHGPTSVSSRKLCLHMSDPDILVSQLTQLQVQDLLVVGHCQCSGGSFPKARLRWHMVTPGSCDADAS